MQICMNEEMNEALRPIESLISKSEKAQQKLTPGTWQHTMLQDNLKALRIALQIMHGQAVHTEEVAIGDYQKALQALASMISRSEKAQMKFSIGTSQHSLQKNRIKALSFASDVILSALNAQANL